MTNLTQIAAFELVKFNRIFEQLAKTYRKVHGHAFLGSAEALFTSFADGNVLGATPAMASDAHFALDYIRSPDRWLYPLEIAGEGDA